MHFFRLNINNFFSVTNTDIFILLCTFALCLINVTSCFLHEHLLLCTERGSVDIESTALLTLFIHSFIHLFAQ